MWNVQQIQPMLACNCEMSNLSQPVLLSLRNVQQIQIMLSHEITFTSMVTQQMPSQEAIHFQKEQNMQFQYHK